MTPRLRKLVLTTHVTTSVGWIGAVATFLVLGIVGLTSRDVGVVRGAYLSLSPICTFVIVPLSLAALTTGLIQSLGTPWGLFRHYWVLMKFLLTILAIAVLLLHQFSALAEVTKLVSEASAGALPRADLGRVGFVLVRASGLGIFVLVVITTMSVYKPWGRTRYGRRKLEEQQQRSKALRVVGSAATPDRGDEMPFDVGDKTREGLPRGLKMFIAAGIGLFVLVEVVSVHLAGRGHRH
jgi:uncharacterized membrane protein